MVPETLIGPPGAMLTVECAPGPLTLTTTVTPPIDDDPSGLKSSLLHYASGDGFSY